MKYQGRHNLYRATIRRMVLRSLEEQEQEFKNMHSSDTNAMMLEYLKGCAENLGHSPWPDEIVGGRTIEERFGSWKRALCLAKLPMPQTANQMKLFARVQEEVELQKQAYRQKKKEKKARAMQRCIKQEERKKEHGERRTL